MLSLLKVPCILLFTIAFHASVTQPHVLDPKERPMQIGMRESFMKATIRIMAWRKAIFWIVGSLEIISIVKELLDENTNRASTTFNATRYYLTPISILGMFLVIAGALVRWECYRTMKTFFTYEISIQENHKLITNGPYSVVRHPAYTGTLLVHIGMYCWFGSRGSSLRESGVLDATFGKVVVLGFASMMMAILVGLISRVPVEDAALKATFGADWDSWADRVPFAMIPGVY